MATAIKPYEGRDFYIPAFEIEVGRETLSKEVVRDIIQVSYKDSLEEVANFEVTINNWDAQSRSFKYSGSKLFWPGSYVDLKMGYKEDRGLTEMINGKITTLRPTFPAGGQPTLTICGSGPVHELRGAQGSHSYEDMTDSEVAKEIAARIGVDIVTDPEAESQEERIGYLLQDNQYDLVFLRERAKRIGYEIYIDRADGERTIHFKPSIGGRRSSYELVYGKSLIQFQPNLDTSNQVSQVTVRSWDCVNRETIEQTITRSDISVSSAGGSEMEQSFADRSEIVSDVPVNSTQEATTMAREFLQENAKSMIKGRGSTVGFPELRAGTAAEISGLDDLFNGRYFITGTTHTIGGSGYTTQFECRREDL
jgi:phage protein D